MRRFLLDTGIAQDFINRRHGVVERSDAERAPGTASASVPRSWASSGLGSREASRERNLQRLRRSLSRLVVWPYTNDAACSSVG